MFVFETNETEVTNFLLELPQLSQHSTGEKGMWRLSTSISSVCRTERPRRLCTLMRENQKPNKHNSWANTHCAIANRLCQFTAYLTKEWKEGKCIHPFDLIIMRMSLFSLTVFVPKTPDGFICVHTAWSKEYVALYLSLFDFNINSLKIDTGSVYFINHVLLKFE